jgi:hypothetical protein
MDNRITKQQIITDLERMYQQWQTLLAGLSDEQKAAHLEPSHWTVKDVLAHLWFWQQASVSRMVAAVQGGQPVYPAWWDMFGPDPEQDVDRTNAWNYAQNRDKSWSQVHACWSDQFLIYLDLLKQAPEQDLLEAGRFTWMGKYRLVDSSLGSFEHHQEHHDTLVAWLKEHNS